MTDRKLQDLRRLTTIPRRRGRCFPAALREHIVAWTAERRARGDEWCALSRELGIAAATLQRWATPRPGPTLSLRPIDVIAVSADASAPRTVTTVTPSGLRIEGVPLADTITLLRELT